MQINSLLLQTIQLIQTFLLPVWKCTLDRTPLEMTSLAVFKMIIHAALNPSFDFAVVAVVWLLSVATELNVYVV